MATSSIEWTEVTWNPTVGCSKASDGCRNCYAMRMAHRLANNPRLDGEYAGLTHVTGDGPQWSRVVRVLPERLLQPLRWRKPRLIFVNSMSDLFHEDVEDEFLAATFAVMAATPQHTFQVLTKRPQRMQEWLNAFTCREHFESVARASLQQHDALVTAAIGASLSSIRERCWPLPNVWLGTSVEDGRVRGRVESLRSVAARVRFLSLEPLLGPLPDLDLEGIDWVIVGGESGPGARPMLATWVHDIRDQCLRAEVPFFFKQWGGVRKGQQGRELDGRTWDQLPAS